MNPSTPDRWAARGRAGDEEAVGFAERFDAVRQGKGEERLSEDDVVRLLEQVARKGAVTACKVLLDRFKAELAKPEAADEFDELKQRRRSRVA